jgi:hypothetical protein
MAMPTPASSPEMVSDDGAHRRWADGTGSLTGNGNLHEDTDDEGHSNHFALFLNDLVGYLDHLSHVRHDLLH